MLHLQMLSSPSEGEHRSSRGKEREQTRAELLRQWGSRYGLPTFGRPNKTKMSVRRSDTQRLDGVLAHQRQRVEGDVEVDCLSVEQLFSCTRYQIIQNKSFVLFLCRL